MQNNTLNNSPQYPLFVTIPENPNYRVYSNGSIQNIKSGRFLKTCKHVLGYRFCSTKLFLNGKKRQLTIHKIVTNAFLGPVPEGKEVHHKDNDKTNNSIYNLAYVTRRENMIHAYNDGLMVNNGWSKLTEENVREIRELRKEGIKNRIIAERFNVGATTICAVNSGQNWAWVN
jgi:hypothetical protein